jgi:hypothetical protein
MRIAALGAGRMGRGIGHVFAYAGYRVDIVDFKARGAEAGARLRADALEEIGGNLALLRDLGVLSEAQRQEMLGRIHVHPLEEAPQVLAAADIVFEGVTETLDNDGWEDLFVANGAVQRVAELVERGDPYPLSQPDAFFRNLGRGTFEPMEVDAAAVARVSRGAARGDLDGDGDDDLVVVDSAAPVRLLRNELRDGSGWIALRAGEGVDPPRAAVGARVEVRLEDGRRLIRRVATDGSYASASSPWILVGTGEGDVRSVKIGWLRGGSSRFDGVPAGRVLTVVRPGGAGGG